MNGDNLQQEFFMETAAGLAAAPFANSNGVIQEGWQIHEVPHV